MNKLQCPYCGRPLTSLANEIEHLRAQIACMREVGTKVVETLKHNIDVFSGDEYYFNGDIQRTAETLCDAERAFTSTEVQEYHNPADLERIYALEEHIDKLTRKRN